jgi:hypothetical protein
MDIEIKVITPIEAASILRHNNPKNRNIQTNRVARYVKEMLSGRWTENGDPIRFDVNGNLIDGQHRLSAVVGASMQQSFLVVKNVEHDAIYTIDTGKTRNAGDILAIDSEVAPQKAQTYAAALKTFVTYKKEGKVVVSAKMNNADVSAAYQEHDVLITEVSDWLFPLLAGQVNLLPKGQVLALAMIFTELCENGAQEFMGDVITGANLADNSPQKNLREFLIKVKMKTIKRTSEEKVNTFIKAWNSYRGGRTQKSTHAVSWKIGEVQPIAK